MKDSLKRRRSDVNKAKVKLLLASSLLNVLIVAIFLTSSPNVSPASGWIVKLHKWLRIAGLKPVTDIKGLHLNSAKVSSEQCISCHGSMKKSSLKLHRIHLTTELAKFECSNCHDKISLEKKSNERVVHMVDVGFCKRCHSKFSGLNPKSAMKPVDFNAECTMCHAGDHSPKHAQGYLIPAITVSKRECKGCHGGRVLPWTSEHEEENWVAKHGLKALEIGKKECMSCHKHGLEFCQDCHNKKPPTHKPKDLWLQKHKVRAKTDTRTCFECHETKYCKKCHLGHTPDWRARHFEAVLKKGISACDNCHSGIFCESCHIASRVNIP